MESKVYNQNGKETNKISLPESVFELSWNGDLVHQVIVAMNSNARTPVAHTKDRSDVRGGGKKPWKQKGTGRARHGSSRSPIWVGGGVAHGPRNEKNYKKKINKKMKAKALYTILSEKLRNNEILFVDNLKFDNIKTSNAKDILRSLSGVSGFEMLLKKRNNSTLITTIGKDLNTYKSFSNFNNIAMEEFRNINPVDLLNYKYLMITEPKESIELIVAKLGNDKTEKAEDRSAEKAKKPVAEKEEGVEVIKKKKLDAKEAKS
jgi:large subunit ribosomal protein L4